MDLQNNTHSLDLATIFRFILNSSLFYFHSRIQRYWPDSILTSITDPSISLSLTLFAQSIVDEVDGMVEQTWHTYNFFLYKSSWPFPWTRRRNFCSLLSKQRSHRNLGLQQCPEEKISPFEVRNFPILSKIFFFYTILMAQYLFVRESKEER